MAGGSADTPLLEVTRLTRRFGGLKAVDDLSFAVTRGAIHGLIGPNGAGKTTTFNLISGFYAPTSGRISYDGSDVTGWRTSALARAGLIRTFQGTTLFQELSALDNVRVGCHRGARAGVFSRIVGADAHLERAADEKARDILAFFDLAGFSAELAANLPHGHQRGLTIMLVEHDMQAVMGLCDVITVMNFGTRLTEGTPEAVRGDPRVIEAYLGRADHAA